MLIDLHMHSRNSDGADSIEELVNNVKKAGISVFSLTDHDRTDGWDRASSKANEYGLSFIPGIEITTEARLPDSKPFGIHLLAYLANPNDPVLMDVLDRNRNAREYRLKKYLANLQQDYPELTYEYVLSHAEEGSTLGRPDIGKALVELKIVASVDESFAKNGILSKSSPHYVRNEALDVLDAIKIVRNAGGVPVIAHPLARSSKKDDDQPHYFPREHFLKMVEAGLLGLETSHTEVQPETKLVLDEFAKEQGLLTTGSSDYHGLINKPRNPLGVRTTTVENLRRILELGTGSRPTLNHEI
jgi:predicted metal-dependent phosphoesterase TrpH